MKTIAVIGCGWLGFPLAQQLVEHGFFVFGSVTRQEKFHQLCQSGIEAVQLIVSDNELICSNHEIFDAEIIIINIPPGRSNTEPGDYCSKIKLLLESLKKENATVIFVSSTSVYADNAGLVDENSETIPSAAGGMVMLRAEQTVRHYFPKAIIVRPGGLIGYNRVPGKFLSGKKSLKDENAPVNLIHRDDLVNVLLHIVQFPPAGEVYNACMDLHPVRKDFYSRLAMRENLPLPEFLSVSVEKSYKVVSSEKFKNQFNYQFLFPDPEKII